MKQRLKLLIPSKRKLMQLYFALLFNANLKGFATGNIYKGATKQFCVPGINCYSCPGAVGACPLGSLQGSFNASRSTLFYVGGILLLYCVLFGRMICGWLCPFGLIQELLHKIPTPKLKKSPVTRLLSWLKYVILVFFVFIIPIMYAFRDTPLPAFCKYICPAGTLEGGIGLLSNAVNDSYFSMLGPLFTWKFLLLISIVVGSVFIFRLFCRFLCPLGALYGIFNRFSIFGIKLDKPKCVNCGACINHCKVDIKQVGDQECISCGECIQVCPTKAISWKGPKILLPKNEIDTDASAEAAKKLKRKRNLTRGVVTGLMLAVLAGAIAYYWVSGPVYEQGCEVGDLCYGAELELIENNGISTDTIDPTKTGEVTVINFWGTWCTPCVAELPYFDQIASEYADSVTVVAVHTHMLSDGQPEGYNSYDYISQYYPDSQLIFARDYVAEGSTLEEYYTTLGGRGTYPYTVVLDEEGIITQIFVSSLTYEELKTAVDATLNG